MYLFITIIFIYFAFKVDLERMVGSDNRHVENSKRIVKTDLTFPSSTISISLMS